MTIAAFWLSDFGPFRVCYEFAKPGAPAMDFVFTVCDQAVSVKDMKPSAIVIKRVFGFAKVRYRGLNKNARAVWTSGR